MRSVVRAAYSGGCVGSSDIGVIRSSAIGCSRLRLASAKKIRMPRTSRTARTSQRLSARVHCWTEMGGAGRITLIWRRVQSSRASDQYCYQVENVLTGVRPSAVDGTPRPF